MARKTHPNPQAHISGYAYETVPNKPIKAGYTGGETTEAGVSASTLMSPTLGMLAVGAQVLDVWRERVAA